MPSIFHIASAEAWAVAQAEGAYRGDTLATEGFIHCSRAEQVEAVANAFYPGRRDLILLRIDRALVVPRVRDEPSGGDLFPHIYGALNLDAVAEVMAFAPGADGRFVAPVSGASVLPPAPRGRGFAGGAGSMEGRTAPGR